MMLSNTALAQGGVAAVLDTTNDSYDLHFEDTLIAGRQENNHDSVRCLSPRDRRMSAEFTRNSTWISTKPPTARSIPPLRGGHSRRRIVHHKDSTGYEIAYRLCEAVKKRDNIEISEFSVLFNLKRFDGGFFAYILKGRKGSDRRHALCRARHRRIGQVYRYTTNSAIATGDGIRLAYDLGCKIAHLDYVQFHPHLLCRRQNQPSEVSHKRSGQRRGRISAQLP